MKKNVLYFCGLLLSLLLMSSCGELIADYPPNEEGFGKLQNSLKERYGADAYYTGVVVSFTPGDDESSGLMVTATLTTEPEKKQLQEWNYFRYTNWRQTAWVTLTLPSDVEPASVMFQLKDKFDLKKVGKLVEESIKKLAGEKVLDGAILKSAYLETPDDSDAADTQIRIVLTSPADKKAEYDFIYDLDGKLLSWKDKAKDED